MDPYYFGASDKQLFGIYHPPASPARESGAVLLLYPLAQEYVRAHRAFQHLATQLSRAGCHVLRFDYYGTGDSAGDMEQASLAQWRDDVRQAIDELIALSGIRQVSLVGLRFGATLAALHGTARVNRLLLWDPVISGRDYLRRLEDMHQHMLVDADRFPAPHRQQGVTTASELLGFEFPQTLRRDLRGIDLLELGDNTPPDTAMLVSDNSAGYEQLRETLGAAGAAVDYRLIEGAGDWDALEKLEDTLMPYAMVRAMVDTLAGG